jgi:DNA-binding CsgD family transcriptional regulator
MFAAYSAHAAVDNAAANVRLSGIATHTGGARKRAYRTGGTHPAANLLGGMLDAIDYGLVLLDDEARVVLMNRLASAEADTGRVLRRCGDRLAAATIEQALRIDTALDECAKGRRSLISFGGAADDLALSFIPLSDGAEPGAGRHAYPYSLVLFSKREVCAQFTLQQFGRQHDLSAAELALLPAISRGLGAEEAAAEHGVGVSTVRSQFSGIRHKTGVKSMRVLMARLNRLPPISPAFGMPSMAAA